MTLDKKITQFLDSVACRDVGDNIKDGQALDYINNLRLDGTHIYLASQYRRYYFDKKSEFKEAKNNGK